MAWPTSKPNSNKFSSDGDSIKDSRPELKTMSDAVNNIVDFIDTSSIANNKILKYNSTSGALEFVTESGGGGGGLANVVEDTSPQLGGDLAMNGNKIVTASGNANIKLAPHGSGVVEIQGDGASEDGTIQLNCSANSHGIKLASPPHSAGQSYTLTFPSTAPANGKILQTDVNGDLSFVDLPSAIDTQIVAGTGISVSQPDSGGAFTITNTAPASGTISPLTADLDTKGFEIGNLTTDSAGEVSPMAMNFTDGGAGGGARHINMYNKSFGGVTAFLQNYKPGRSTDDFGGLQFRSYKSSDNLETLVGVTLDAVNLQSVKTSLTTHSHSINISSNGLNISASGGTQYGGRNSNLSISSSHKIQLKASGGVVLSNSTVAGAGQQITLDMKGDYTNDYKLVFPASLSDGPLFVTQVTADSAGDPIEQYDISVGSRSAGYVNGGIKTGNFTAVAGEQYIINGALTATLPSGPQAGDRVSFVSINTGNFTVGRNGSNIDGAASDFTRHPNAKSNEDIFIYTNATEGWQGV